MTVLKVSYWNIHGHTSKVVGDKLCDPEFLDMVRETDILGMGELHAEEKVSIPGFVNIKQINSSKKICGTKSSGRYSSVCKGGCSRPCTSIGQRQ